MGVVSRAVLAERTETDTTTLSRWHRMELVEGVRDAGERAWRYRPIDQAVVTVLATLLRRGLRAPATLAAVSAALYGAGLERGVAVVVLGEDPSVRVDELGTAAMEAMMRARADGTVEPLLVVPFGPLP